MESVVKLNRKLGVGGRGVVYEGFDHALGHFVAVKELAYMEPSTISSDGEDTELAEILSELACMREAQHPNLVQYYGARRSAVGVQIVMEYVSGGSLDYVLTRCGPLREAVARAYTRDILEALRYLHEEMHVCHRDVKPANILITPDGRCKLADFGVAKQVEEGPSRHHQHQQQQQQQQQQQHSTSPSPRSDGGGSAYGSRGPSGVREGYLQTAVGTPWYMAPEVINGGVEDDSDDGDAEEDEEVEEFEEDEYVQREAVQPHASGVNDSFDDWTNACPTTAVAGDSPVPAPPSPLPLYVAGGAYYNPLKKILRKGRLTRRSVGYTTRADIWSVGVTVYEMMTGTRPFGADLHNPSAVMFRIANCATAPPRLPAGLAVSPTLQNFLDLCFVYDRDLRATARELLGHPWLRGSGAPAGATTSSSSGNTRTLHARHRSGSGGVGTAAHSTAAQPVNVVSQPPVRQSVFDGVAALDALDLPPSHSLSIPRTPAVAEKCGSSVGVHAGGATTAREEEQSRHHVRRLSSTGRRPEHSGRDAPVLLQSSPSVLREASPVSPAEQAEASSRYAAARQRIGHTRSSVSRSSATAAAAAGATPALLMPDHLRRGGGGGLQTKYGAYVDLLSHP